MATPFFDLVYRCTVRIDVPNSHGTGFFVAPGLILTCAHVVEAAKDDCALITVVHDSKPLVVDIQTPEKPYPDLALLRINFREHPCVYLDASVDLGDTLFGYGYSSTYEHGAFVKLEYEGPARIDSQNWLLQLSGGQVVPGYSGSPLVNKRTLAVCGIVKKTRDVYSDLGGGGIPTEVILSGFPGLTQLQCDYHSTDDRWEKARKQQINLIEKPPHSKPLAEDKTPSDNLPPSCFYVDRGRHYADEIIEQLSARHETPWIIGISGIPGIGKTSLALKAAHHHRSEESFDAIIWVIAETRSWIPISEDRQKATSFNDLYDEIAEVLKIDSIIRLESITEKRKQVREALKGSRCLLVIDGVEGLGGWDIFNDLKDFVQPTKIIATSNIHADQVDHHYLLEGMDREAALELMRAECKAKSVKASDEELESLYDKIGGIPLAMVCCIGEMSAHPVEHVLKRMSKVKGDLLEYCFSGSMEGLSSEAKRVLRIASFFATSSSYDALFTASGIEARSDIDEAEDVFYEAIDQLIGLSLVSQESGRYSLLPLLRMFVLNKLKENEPNEFDRLKYAYVEYFLHYAEEHASRSEEDLAALATERKNIREAINCCADQYAEDIVRRMLPKFATALYEFQWLRGYWNELAEYNELAFNVSKLNEDRCQMGDCAYRIGFTRFQQGNCDEADKWGKEAVRAMTQTGSEYHSARVKRLPAIVARERCESEASRQWLGEMLESGRRLLENAGSDEEARKIKDNILADALTSLANLERKEKKYSEAQQLYEESLKTNRELSNTEKIGLNLNHLGRTYLAKYEQAKNSNQDDDSIRYLTLAEEYFTEGRQASEEAPRADQILIGMWGQARVAEERGEYAQALKLAREALDRYRHSGAAEVAEAQELLDRVKPE
jgi:hypothetical protein